MTWTDDLLWAIDSAQDEQALFAVVRNAAQELGFEYCAYAMRMPVPVTNPRIILVSNYPGAWQQRYAQKKYLESDPTVAMGWLSPQPIVWSDAVFASAPELWREARDAGLRVGWTKSSLDGHSVVGLLTLARSEGALTESELEAKELRMCWLAHMAHQGFRRIFTAQWSVSLSVREKDVLRWAADGKTLTEISEILEISVATVKFHTRNAVEKLGTINRTAAVAHAAVMGLLV